MHMNRYKNYKMGVAMTTIRRIQNFISQELFHNSCITRYNQILQFENKRNPTTYDILVLLVCDTSRLKIVEVATQLYKFPYTKYEDINAYG